MAEIVDLDLVLWRGSYPRYSAATDAQIVLWWDVAQELIDNTPASPIPFNPPEIRTRQIILYALVCHLAALDARGDGAVGRIASAGEGSVNSSFDYGVQSASSAWWNQTQAGATAWRLLKPYRTGGLYFDGGCEH